MNYKIYFILILIVTTILIAIFAPYDEVTINIGDLMTAYLVLAAIAFFEASFMAGLLVMAYAVGHDLGSNPLKWKSHLKQIAQKVTDDRVFWVGFWVNFVGAVGTTTTLIIAAIFFLPIQAWGVALIGVFDLLITLILRKEIISLKSDIQ